MDSPFANVHWNDFLVASLLGLPDVDIDRMIEASRALSASPAEEEPPTKRPRTLPSRSTTSSPRICLYRHLRFRSGLSFSFSDEDGKDILTPPSLEPNLFLRKLLSKLPSTLRGRLQFLAQFDPTDEVIDADEGDGEEDEGDGEEEGRGPSTLYATLRDDFYCAYLREMRLRNAFRSLLQRWRIHRIHRKPLPSLLDPITLQPPHRPVLLYDIPRQTRYVYDAAALSTWMEANLTHHEGGFATPHAPRNPWTNLPFTYPQLLSLYPQLQTHGTLGWALTTFRQHQFHLSRWHTYHATALTLSAIRKSLAQLDTSHARDMLADFIFMKMEDLHVYQTPRIHQTYYYAIAHHPTHWFLELFKDMAYQHYEAEHLGQNRFRYIHCRCDRIFQRHDRFLEEMRQKEEEDDLRP